MRIKNIKHGRDMEYKHFLRMALIENIREACEKIYSAQLQKI